MNLKEKVLKLWKRKTSNNIFIIQGHRRLTLEEDGDNLILYVSSGDDLLTLYKAETEQEKMRLYYLLNNLFIIFEK